MKSRACLPQQSLRTGMLSYAELYFDIETDDSVPGWDAKETWRHLSYSAVLKGRDGKVERQLRLLCFGWNLHPSHHAIKTELSQRHDKRVIRTSGLDLLLDATRTDLVSGSQFETHSCTGSPRAPLVKKVKRVMQLLH